MGIKLAGKLRKLAQQITRLEGKKSQVKFGDALEVLRVMATIEAKMVHTGKSWRHWPTVVVADYSNSAGIVNRVEKRKAKKVTILRKRKPRKKK